METHFVLPRYDAGGFAGLPERILKLLESDHYAAVVLFLIDGFGWRFFERFADGPFLSEVTREGTVTRLTAQFPSTTAAHLTTIHTGMPVGEHGIFEWYYYEPELDATIAPLLYSYAGTLQRDTLKAADIKPSRLYPGRNLYRPLKKRHLQAALFQSREYTPSTYTDAVMAGAQTHGFKTLPEGLVNLSAVLTQPDSPRYGFFYFDKVDSISHEYGPTAPQTEAEILSFLLTMETIFLKPRKTTGKKILCLLTADHGQVETDPQKTIYLNRDPAFAGVEKYLKANQAGQLLVPAGSARDFFLYIRDEALDEAREFLARRLEGRAEVRKVADLAEAGYFGPVVSPLFRARAGNLVILPYRGESVWWYEKGHYEQRFRGHHGGLTAEEMEIPLIVWEMM